MIKFCGHYITCQEVPNEVSLTFSITNCPHHCPGCHSSWLQSDIGDQLTESDLDYYIKKYLPGITCICFMGTGGDPEALAKLVDRVELTYGLSTCVYTGDDDTAFLLYCADHGHCSPEYFKYGPYDERAGGLDHPETNQHMLKLTGKGYEDITDWFWRKKE